MALSSKQYVLIVQRIETILAQKTVPKVLQWPSYGNFGKVAKNPHFLIKERVFEKSPKKQPAFERPRSTLPQMALSSNQYALKDQRLENVQAQTAAPNMPEWPSYGNFREVIQNPHFLKKCKGGTKGNFSKIVQKVNLV